jgi:uncharacterized cupin superfamily protein
MSASAVRLLLNGDPESGMGPSSLTDPECFLADNPSETIHTPFTNAQGNVTAGVWECSPCLEKIERYGVDELCTVLSGSVTVTGEDGIAHTFGPGDSFVMPQDFKGTWHITETLKKFYMIAEPPSDT